MADVGQYHYPFLPVRLLLRDRFPSIDRIHRLRSPLLVIAGQHDRVVPIQQSRRLYEAASARKRLVVVPEADHNADELLAGDDVIRAIVRSFCRSGDEMVKSHVEALDLPATGHGGTDAPICQDTRFN